MSTKEYKKLNKRQLAVIDDLFTGQMDEVAVLEIHEVSMAVFRKWLNNSLFTNEFRFRFDAARRQSQVIIAQYAPVAAAKLVELTGSEKEETARKACLDILGLPNAEDQADPERSDNDTKNIKTLPPKLATKLMEVLAKEMGQK